MEVKSDLDASMDSSSTALEVMDELEVECIEAIELMCLVPSKLSFTHLLFVFETYPFREFWKSQNRVL